MSDLLLHALEDLLGRTDDDHQRLCLIGAGEGAPPPQDPALAALAVELHRLRWLEPEAPVMALLADAAAQHGEAVERHLVWLAENGTAPAYIALVDPAPAYEQVALAS